MQRVRLTQDVLTCGEGLIIHAATEVSIWAAIKNSQSRLAILHLVFRQTGNNNTNVTICFTPKFNPETHLRKPHSINLNKIFEFGIIIGLEEQLAKAIASETTKVNFVVTENTILITWFMLGETFQAEVSEEALRPYLFTDGFFDSLQIY